MGSIFLRTHFSSTTAKRAPRFLEPVALKLTLALPLFLVVPLPFSLAAAEIMEVIEVPSPSGYLTSAPGDSCEFNAQAQALRISRSASGNYVSEVHLRSASTGEDAVIVALNGPAPLGEFENGLLVTPACPVPWDRWAAMSIDAFDCASGFVSIRGYGPWVATTYYVTASGSGTCKVV